MVFEKAPGYGRLVFIFVSISVLSPGFSTSSSAATGPGSSDTPYLRPTTPNVEFTSVLTVGDRVKKKFKGNETYRMVGIPDGLGAYDNGDGTFTLLMNHELRANAGIVRIHGATGAFVSKWEIRKHDLKVLNGEDLIKTVKLWKGDDYVTTPNAVFNRLCSADLAVPSAFFNSHTGKGFNAGRMFLSGEEIAVGRAFAHLASGRQQGTSYELPRLGRAAWENVIASPHEQDKTIVALLDDGEMNASKIYFYIGVKQDQGNPVELAGLTNGTSYAVLINGFATESAGVPIPNGYTGSFSLVPASAGTGLNRVEDGAWDSVDPRRFYFVTTASFTGNSRLWRLSFHDIAKPLAGGNVEVLVDGSVDGPIMMDNMTVDDAGHVYIQEDVGNRDHLGRIWKYDPFTDSLTQLAEHDANRFLSGAPGDIDGSGDRQSNEESSGIIEVTDLFAGVKGYDIAEFRYFLLTVQAHYPSVNGIPLDAELVEGGQLLMMKVPK